MSKNYYTYRQGHRSIIILLLPDIKSFQLSFGKH